MSEELRNENYRRLSQDELSFVKDQLLESIYIDIGKSVVKKILWVFGAVVLAAFAWLAGHGLIKLGD